MNPTPAVNKPLYLTIAPIRYLYLLRALFAGLLIPLGFAPFHLPGLSIVGIALLYAQLQQQTLEKSFYTGFVFGLGFLGLGVSWVYVSIHQYGHLNAPLSALITGFFVCYLALFPALAAMTYTHLAKKRTLLLRCFIFSAVWCLSEFLRATLLGGFPWLLLGFGQMDTPLKYLLPIVGVFGVGFFACLAASFVASAMQKSKRSRYPWIIACVAVLIAPYALKNIESSEVSHAPLSVGVIQANLSMRDKWDEALFWQLLRQYKTSVGQLLGKKQLIVLPESAIPIPASYISDVLETIDQEARVAHSAVLLGIPQPTTVDETYFYNTVTALGTANGTYLKQHLVPFGEFIPEPFQQLMAWLALPAANMKPGRVGQPLMSVNNHAIATLICYELAYPQLLRRQLPDAEWIVSISDDGWFGHSFAMYQQLQMAQVLSMQTGRFQVVANNDGLSAVINTQGEIVSALPAFSAGILDSEIYPATGASVWVNWGDLPVLLMSVLIVLLAFFRVNLMINPMRAAYKALS